MAELGQLARQARLVVVAALEPLALMLPLLQWRALVVLDLQRLLAAPLRLSLVEVVGTLVVEQRVLAAQVAAVRGH
jgi:hypothetical protein